MKKTTTLAILCAVLISCIGVYLFLPQEDEKEVPTTPEPTRIPVISVPPEEIDSLSWEYAARTLSFQRQADGWTYPEDAHFPMDQNSSRFSAILQSLSSLSASRCLSDIEDPSEYGLDSPTTVIRVTRTDGTETRLILGAQNPVTGEYYLQIEGNTAVYLIDATLPSAFACGLFDLVKTDTIPNLSAATEYRIDGRTYYKNADGFWCSRNGNTDTPIDEGKSDALTNALETLQWFDCIDYYTDYYETKTDIYGLEHGKTISVTAGDTVWTLAVGNAYDEGHTVVSPADSTIAYTMDNATVNALLLQ